MAKKNFALLGLGGYIAPRHLKAIKETGNELLAAMDTSDSVGVIDSYFEDVDFFTEFERFDRHVDKLRQEKNKKIDFVSICTPNYLHDSHIRFGLRNDADVICEKPIVLNEKNIDGLLEVQDRYPGTIYTILQLREHQAILDLKKKVDSKSSVQKHNIDLHYITPRGKWYDYSWKGDIEKSGGVATNIGVHFFDMLTWIFGKPEYAELHLNDPKHKMAGFLSLEKANVRWYLSVDRNDLKTLGKNTTKAYRALSVNNEEFDFSKGFTDLHTKVYQSILNGKGYTIEDTRNAISLVEKLRFMPEQKAFDNNQYHPVTKKIKCY
ncbi:MAG: Gfo/Idh/MocA family oxidoreductase [Candidatus Nanoarchaeia archaeon]